ncbi:hypothetical protein F5B17DRAFT_228039 [Nemania serpens]|nr:hypothetical protein F5B17DRAFT_228039 [Nemania serpens]
MKNRVSVPSKIGLSESISSISPLENYADPEKFDVYRFLHKRFSSSSEINRHRFVSTGPDNLAFGHGNASCPGRLFAGVHIKILLARILLKFNVAFLTGQETRPENIHKAGSISPDRGVVRGPE